ncbi:tetratricopeptide repeat protein [bacterium]|nr:tetratricopeptide repeat protein [bacterium]
MRVTLIGLILGLLMGGCAEESDATAQNLLGLRYKLGIGAPQDDKEAVKWFRMSAEQGSAPGQSNLGAMYYHGTGVPQDYKEACAWWSVAKANGQENGQELAEKNLGIVIKEMTNEQIAEAQSLATEISKRIEANKKH